MRRSLFFILFIFFVSCSRYGGMYIKQKLEYPKKVHSLIDLADNKRNNKRINFNKVKGVVVDIEKLKNNRLTEKGFEILKDCHAVEYIRLIYPKGYLENDFSIELSEAISKMNEPKEIYMTLDSADYIPNVFHGSNEIQQITIKGNFIKMVSVNTLSQDNLNILSINCSTDCFNFNGKDLSHLESLSLIIKGKTQNLDFSGLKELKYFNFINEEIENLPDNFFELPNLLTLILSFPGLKKINENISNLKSLKTFLFTSYEINELPGSLSKLEHLDWVSINTNGKVESLKPLTKLPKLKRLSISGINLLEVVDEVLLMKKLKALDFSLHPLLNKDLSPLGQLEKLKEIRFQTTYTERDGDNYIRKDLSDSTKNEILNQLKKVLPEHF